MKKIFLLIPAVLFAAMVIGQDDFSGAYGYAYKAPAGAPKTEADRGQAGTLVLLKMEGNKYRFWLDLTLGWPSYAVGETDGTLLFVNDTASFDNTFEHASTPCVLHFTRQGAAITIKSGSPSYNCGFGNNVRADGEYPRLKKQPVLDNAWLEKEYGQSPKTLVVAEKAQLFRDENCLQPFNPAQYFSRGDVLLLIADAEKSIYTEHISTPGRLTYGWLRKSDVRSPGQ